MNATSPCDCGLGVGFAGKAVRTLMQDWEKMTLEQRLAV